MKLCQNFEIMSKLLNWVKNLELGQNIKMNLKFWTWSKFWNEARPQKNCFFFGKRRKGGRVLPNPKFPYQKKMMLLWIRLKLWKWARFWKLGHLRSFLKMGHFLKNVFLLNGALFENGGFLLKWGIFFENWAFFWKCGNFFWK